MTILDEAFEQWLHALLSATSTPGGLLGWQERRSRFGYHVGQLLCGPVQPGLAPLLGHAVYGVYVTGGGLDYVGQTTEAERRLRDLPIGESHHLATTVPHEVWERVVVVQWPDLLVGAPLRECEAAERLGLGTCGLALEHLLQLSYKPVLTARRRTATGRWRARRIEASRPRGAVHGSLFPGLFEALQVVWDSLAAEPAPDDGQAVCYSPAGRVVFPGSLLNGMA
jgi:hypothetical protein